MATTRLELEGDGIIENLFYFLWAKDEFDRGSNLNIPDTVLFQYTQPVQWYFTSVSGQLMRKSKMNTVIAKIEKEFLKKSIGNNVIAYYISIPQEGDQATIEYFDENGLSEFLHNREKLNDGVLQRFIEPKGTRNSMIRAIWSPKLCLLERRINDHKLHDKRYGLYEKSVTFEGNDHLSTSEPVRGAMLSGEIQELCHRIVDHVDEVSFHKNRISRMALNLKVDAKDRIWVLWCSSLRLEDSGEKVKTKAPLDVGVGVTAPGAKELCTSDVSKNLTKTPTLICSSCAAEVNEARAHQIIYKSIMTHFDQLLEHLGIEYDNVRKGAISWPPDEKVIAAAGGVGFGILKLIDTQAQVNGSTKSQLEAAVSIPPAIRYLHPNLCPADFIRFKKDPMFLYKLAPTCTDCYLVYADYSMSALEQNALHRGAPKLLRPRRTKLSSPRRLEPLHSPVSRSQNRRRSATAWDPVLDKEAERPAPTPAWKSKGLAHMPVPKLPSRIDASLIREFESNSTNKQYSPVTSPKVSIPARDISTAVGGGRKTRPGQSRSSMTTSSASNNRPETDDNDWQVPAATSFGEMPSSIQQRENEFFEEMYANPNIDKSHPLSHMIETAARMQQIQKSNRSLTTSASEGDFGSTPFLPSTTRQTLSTADLNEPATPPVKTIKPPKNPYKIKQTLKESPSAKKKKKAKKVTGSKGAVLNTLDQASLETSISSGGAAHRDFLLQTLSEVRDKLNTTENLYEVYKETEDILASNKDPRDSSIVVNTPEETLTEFESPNAEPALLVDESTVQTPARVTTAEKQDSSVLIDESCYSAPVLDDPASEVVETVMNEMLSCITLGASETEGKDEAESFSVAVHPMPSKDEAQKEAEHLKNVSKVTSVITTDEVVKVSNEVSEFVMAEGIRSTLEHLPIHGKEENE